MIEIDPIPAQKTFSTFIRLAWAGFLSANPGLASGLEVAVTNSYT